MARAESAVLLIGDTHYGKKTSTFNIDVLTARLTQMTENACKVSSIVSKSYKIRRLHMFLLGDCIDNDCIYHEHPFNVDERAAFARRQVLGATEMMAPILLRFQKEFGEVVVDGVLGNHGAVSRYTHRANNWDLMFYDMLGLKLDHETKIKINVHEDFYAIVEVESHGFLLNHGKGIRMYQAIPWYGATQRVMRWSGSMSKPFIAACFGHFHTFGNQWWIDKEIFFNGTAVTDDDFPLEVLGMDGVPRYWLFGVHEERGITWRYPINLLE